MYTSVGHRLGWWEAWQLPIRQLSASRRCLIQCERSIASSKPYCKESGNYFLARVSNNFVTLPSSRPRGSQETRHGHGLSSSSRNSTNILRLEVLVHADRPVVRKVISIPLGPKQSTKEIPQESVIRIDLLFRLATPNVSEEGTELFRKTFADFFQS